MISPEILYRYPFFGGLDDAQIKAIALIAQEENLASGVTIFHEGQRAESLYFLVDGSVALYYMGGGTILEKYKEGIPVDDINPGEPFGFSALIEPCIYTSTARATKPCREIKFGSEALKTLFNLDQRLAYLLTLKAAQAAVARLSTTRMHLAAAWA